MTITDTITTKRRGAQTRIYRGEELLGWIMRHTDWNPSPRGRARRVYHYPFDASGMEMPRCYTRKEAITDILTRYEYRTPHLPTRHGYYMRIEDAPTSKRIGEAYVEAESFDAAIESIRATLPEGQRCTMGYRA